MCNFAKPSETQFAKTIFRRVSAFEELTCMALHKFSPAIYFTIWGHLWNLAADENLLALIQLLWFVLLDQEETRVRARMCVCVFVHVCACVCACEDYRYFCPPVIEKKIRFETQLGSPQLYAKVWRHGWGVNEIFGEFSFAIHGGFNHWLKINSLQAKHLQIDSVYDWEMLKNVKLATTAWS